MNVKVLAWGSLSKLSWGLPMSEDDASWWAAAWGKIFEPTENRS